MGVTVPFNETLKDARERLGIPPSRAAAMLCMSEMEYYDLENYDNEWRVVVPAFVIGFAASIFEIDWRNSHDWPREGGTDASMPLNEFLTSIRKSRGATKEEFAARIGFSSSFVEVIEGHPSGLALWPVEVTILLAQAFDVRVLSLAECVLEPQTVYARIAAAQKGA